jgi:hypothetical protein
VLALVEELTEVMSLVVADAVPLRLRAVKLAVRVLRGGVEHEEQETAQGQAREFTEVEPLVVVDADAEPAAVPRPGKKQRVALAFSSVTSATDNGNPATAGRILLKTAPAVTSRCTRTTSVRLRSVTTLRTTMTLIATSLTRRSCVANASNSDTAAANCNLSLGSTVSFSALRHSSCCECGCASSSNLPPLLVWSCELGAVVQLRWRKVVCLFDWNLMNVD